MKDHLVGRGEEAREELGRRTPTSPVLSSAMSTDPQELETMPNGQESQEPQHPACLANLRG